MKRTEKQEKSGKRMINQHEHACSLLNFISNDREHKQNIDLRHIFFKKGNFAFLIFSFPNIPSIIDFDVLNRNLVHNLLNILSGLFDILRKQLVKLLKIAKYHSQHQNMKYLLNSIA